MLAEDLCKTNGTLIVKIILEIDVCVPILWILLIITFHISDVIREGKIHVSCKNVVRRMEY